VQTNWNQVKETHGEDGGLDIYIIKRLKEFAITLKKINNYLLKLRKIKWAHGQVKVHPSGNCASVEENVRTILEESEYEVGSKRRMSFGSFSSMNEIQEKMLIPSKVKIRQENSHDPVHMQIAKENNWQMLDI
jgi:hypothetical protein